MNTEDYVSFETAKLLKEKGFDGYCFAFHKEQDKYEIHPNSVHFAPTLINNEYLLDKYIIICPTLQMAMKWLREVHNRYVEICIDKAHNFKDIVFRPAIYDKSLDCLWESDNFPTYEEACEAAIKYCLTNLI